MNRVQMYVTRMGATSHSTKIKAAICAAAVLVLAYLVFVQGAQEVTANRGARAAEGIRMTSVQAEEMSGTASAVGTLIKDAAWSADQPPHVAGRVTPDPQDRREGSSEDVWYVRRIESLVEHWEPRYSAARYDIDRFEHRFRTTQERLREYFSEQGDLTASVHDPYLRAELRRRDSEELEAYDRWTVEGKELLIKALAMRRELDDMDTVIRKQLLTVSMLSEYTAEVSIPASAESLYQSLNEFRNLSDELAGDLSTHVFN